MVNLFMLIDSRHKPQKNDIEFMAWLGEKGVPFSIIFTKLDKMSSSAAKKAVETYCNQLKEEWEELPPVFKSSSVDGRGRHEILNYIEELNKLTID